MTRKGMATPGWSETWLGMTPLRRMGMPTEVANAVWFLASDAASRCTGSYLVVGDSMVW